MGLYNKPVLDLLYALINRDNPGLTIPLSPENTVLLGGPYTNNLGTSGRDTRAVFNAVAGKGYTGNLEVFYDRINLGYLFNNLSPKVTVPYLATTRAQMLPYINEALGLQLTVADIAMPTTAAALSTTATGNITITVVTTCLAFSGEFTFTFVRELPRLVDVYLPDNDRYMSQWLNFAFAGKIHARNFEAWRSTLNAVQKGVPLVTSTPGAAAFLTMLINTTGIPFTLGTTLPANPAAYDITGAVLTQVLAYTLPDTRPHSQNVFVLTPIPGKHVWTKPLYFHAVPRLNENTVVGYDDLVRYIAGNKFATVGGEIGVQPGKIMAIDLSDITSISNMYGSPYGTYFKLGNSWATRIAQHCFPDQASYDYAVANKLKVVATIGPAVKAPAAFTSVTRNGFTSEAAAADTLDGCTVTNFIYVDAATKTLKSTNPFTKSAPVAWIP